MPRPERDEVREHRIIMEIVVDAYDELEQAMGWYAYLEDHLAFPFAAICVRERSISPLDVGERMQVTGMADADECEHEMFVTVRWKRRTLGVPLAQLQSAVKEDQETVQAIEDWHYWVDQGRQL